MNFVFLGGYICCLVDMRGHRSCLPDTITFLRQSFIDVIITHTVASERDAGGITLSSLEIK